ncbi:MAG: helix-hairpin-helix domain-containing protein [Acidobacteriota bacterium]
MNKPNRIEDFIVSIEDSGMLLKLYLQRVARSPGNAVYYQAISEHATEIKTAAEMLYNNISYELALLPRQVAVATVNYVEQLVNLSHLIDELARRLAAHQITVIMQAIDMMRDAMAALERLTFYLGQAEIQDLSDISRTVKALENLLYAEPISSEVAGGLEFLADEVLVQSKSEPENQYEEEDPFDEIEIGGDLIDEIVGGFESALDAVVQPDAGLMAAARGEAEYQLDYNQDADQLQDLFANIAASYVQPVKAFIIELRNGHASKEWIDVCRPAIQSISRAAHTMSYVDLSEMMDRFDELLATVAQGEGRLVAGNNKRKLLESYAQLEAAMPQTFSLGEDMVTEFSKRDGIIVNSLLKQIKGVGVTTIRKLFASGMTSLENYYLAKKEDLVAISGIRPWLAQRICERFADYQREQQELSVNNLPGRQREKLTELVEELKRQQFLFKKATLEDWYANEESEKKRQCRKQRQQVMWQINVALAEIGSKEAMSLLKELKRHIFERRIEHLQHYIDHMEG